MQVDQPIYELLKTSTHLSKSAFNLFLSTFLPRCNRSEISHPGTIIRRRLFIIAKPPRETLPPGAVELVPESLAVTPLARLVFRKPALEKLFSGALEISFRTTAPERGLPYM